MGLFDALTGGFEKLERQGDEAVARKDGLSAYGRFRDALRKAGKKDPLAGERLRGKLRQAGRLIVQAKTREAEQFLKDDVPEAAIEAIQIAQQYQEEADARQREALARLAQRAQVLIDPEAGAAGGDPMRPAVAAGLPGAAVGLGAEELAAPDEPDAELEALFEQMSGALAPEDQERAADLGAAFQSGFVALQMDRTAEALAALQQAAAEHPGDPLVTEHLALALDQAGDAAGARAHYRGILDETPTRMNSRLALAGILAASEPHQGVQPYARWFALAQAARGRDPSEALDLLEEGTGVDDAHAGTYLAAAAEISLAHGRPAQAAAFLDRALQNPGGNQAILWQLYAVAMEMNGALDDAQTAIEKAVQLGGQALFFRAEFAEFALRHRRAVEKARETIFQTCLGCQATRPHDDELTYYGFLLTRLQHAGGEFKEALEGIDRLLEQGPPETLAMPLKQLRQVVVRDLQNSLRGPGGND